MADLFQKILDFLLEFLPVRIVREWEQGVRSFCGRMQDEPLTAGVWWFWPFLGDIHIQPCVDEVVETELQTVTIQDGTSLTFSLAVRYRVKDAVAMFRAVREHDDSILEAIRSAAGWAATWSDDLENAQAHLAEATEKQARKYMRGWGIEIRSVAIINLTTSPVLRLMQSE